MIRTVVVHFGGHAWLKIIPPWIAGPRPAVTYRLLS